MTIEEALDLLEKAPDVPRGMDAETMLRWAEMMVQVVEVHEKERCPHCGQLIGRPLL